MDNKGVSFPKLGPMLESWNIQDEWPSIQVMAEKNPNWGGARPGAGRRSMSYKLDRDQWDMVVSALRREGTAEAAQMADGMEAWLVGCDVAWEQFQVALSKYPRRQRKS